ncbi:hypothetical protein ACOXH8_08960 [Nannocystis pusilla]
MVAGRRFRRAERTTARVVAWRQRLGDPSWVAVFERAANDATPGHTGIDAATRILGADPTNASADGIAVSEKKIGGRRSRRLHRRNSR